MSENKTVLLKVTLDIAELEKRSKIASENLIVLKNKQDDLKKSTGVLTPEYSKLSTEIRLQKKELDTLSGAIVKTEKLNKNNTGSIVEQRLALEAGIVAYNNLTKEQLENAEIGGKLASENLALKNSINEQQEAVGNFTGSVGNYSKGLTELKAELKNLKGEMVGLDAGSEEYQKASEKAGKLGDKIKEVNENVKASSGGTGFEKLSNNLGLVQDDLMNMDFAGVSEKMKQMAVISKSMTFTEVLGGLKGLGSGLVSLGKAILMNPLFLIAGAVVGIVGALKMWSDSIDENAIKAQDRHTDSMQKNIDKMELQANLQNKLAGLNLKLLNLQGKSEAELSKERLNNFDEEYKSLEQQILAKYKLERQYRVNFASATSEDRQKDLNDKITALRDERVALQNEFKFRDANRIILNKENNLAINNENKQNNEKALSERQKFNDERLSLERQLKDLILGNETLSNENQRKVIEATFESRKFSASENAEELLKIEGEKNEALSKLNSDILEDELAKLAEAHRREVQDAKGNQKIILELNNKFELEKKGLNKDANSIQNQQDAEYLKSVETFNKQKIESERKTANDIKLIDAELNLIKVKGTSLEEEAFRAFQDAKIAVLKSNAEAEVLIAGKTKDEINKINSQLALDTQKVNNETFEQVKVVEIEKTAFIQQENLNKINSGVGSAQQLADALVQIKQNETAQELINEKDKFDTKSKLLQDQLDAGLISTADFNAKKSANDAEYAKKESELKREQFKRNKQQAIINATIATALAVTNALATPPPASFVFAGLAGVLGAVNVATIVSQPTPKFAKGGIAKMGVFGGESHSNGGTKGVFSDGTQIEVEKDENFYILNKKSSAMISKLSSINQLGGGVPLMKNGGVLNFATGGVLGSSVSSGIDSRISLRNEMIQALEFLPSPIVSVEDINTGQANKVYVAERANF